LNKQACFSKEKYQMIKIIDK